MNLYFREGLWECYFSLLRQRNPNRGIEPVGAGFALGEAAFRAVKGKEGQLRGSRGNCNAF